MCFNKVASVCIESMFRVIQWCTPVSVLYPQPFTLTFVYRCLEITSCAYKTYIAIDIYCILYIYYTHRNQIATKQLPAHLSAFWQNNDHRQVDLALSHSFSVIPCSYQIHTKKTHTLIVCYTRHRLISLTQVYTCIRLRLHAHTVTAQKTVTVGRHLVIN